MFVSNYKQLNSKTLRNNIFNNNHTSKKIKLTNNYKLTIVYKTIIFLFNWFVMKCNFCTGGEICFSNIRFVYQYRKHSSLYYELIL